MLSLASSFPLCRVCGLPGVFSFPNASWVQSVRITRPAPGATVELGGAPVGGTPLEKSFSGGYFHGTKTAFGQRLEHPRVARVALPGYINAIAEQISNPSKPSQSIQPFRSPLHPRPRLQDGFGYSTLTSDLTSAESSVDARFLGNAPAAFKHPAGSQAVRV